MAQSFEKSNSNQQSHNKYGVTAGWYWMAHFKSTQKVYWSGSVSFINDFYMVFIWYSSKQHKFFITVSYEAAVA